MYYVIYVGAGNEDTAETYIKRGTSEGLCTSCFHPVRHMRKKLRGRWTDYHERLIPGYVFIESEDILALYEELRKRTMFMRVLGKEANGDSVVFHELSENEKDWLRKLTGDFSGETGLGESPVVELSQVGFDENDQVTIVSGPLKNVTGLIKKINLHKRTAEVEIELMGQKVSIYLGFEILGGRQKDET